MIIHPTEEMLAVSGARRSTGTWLERNSGAGKRVQGQVQRQVQRLRVVACGRSLLRYACLASGCELGVHPGLAREDAAACTTKIEQTGEINEQTTRRTASYRDLARIALSRDRATYMPRE